MYKNKPNEWMNPWLYIALFVAVILDLNKRIIV